jgi:cell volume regulation protein A
VGTLALALGVFAGGLQTDWASVQPVLRKGLALSTVGVLLSAALVGAFAHLALGLSLLEGLLLGAIISSTDSSTVFSLLRSERVNLRGQLRPLLELESGSNDPMAFFLTTSMIYLITHPAASALALIPKFVLQMLLGAAMGVAMGRGVVWLVNHFRLEHDGLYPVLTVAVALLTYSATSALEGNGILAVYAAGLVMGNSDFIHKKSLIRFHDGLAWLMEIAMFVLLGILVPPAQVAAIWPSGCLLALFLIVVARPVSVFLTLSFSGLDRRDKGLLAWVGLRGATPIILATFPLLSGLSKAPLIFNLVFFVVTTSVLLKGASLKRVARWLGVDAPVSRKRPAPLEFVRTHGVKSDLMELPIPPDSAVAGKCIVELGLPKGTLVVLIGRGTEFMIPSGGTALERGDTLLVLADHDSLRETKRILSVQQTVTAVEPETDVVPEAALNVRQEECELDPEQLLDAGEG